MLESITKRAEYGRTMPQDANFKTRKINFTNKYFRNADMDLTVWRKQFPDDLTKTVVQIPARSGSTRIKNKNIREICGKPLFAYTIEVARAITGVDRVLVNTDNYQYAKIAEEYGAEAPFIRPAEISTDQSSPYWAYYFVFRKLIDENYPIKTIITLAPTNPFRNVAHFEGLVKKLKECGDVQTAVPVSLAYNALAFPEKHGLKAVNVLPNEGNILFKPLGHFSGRHCLREHIFGKHIEFLTNPVELIDIDVEDDFRLAQKIIENELYDFGVAI